MRCSHAWDWPATMGKPFSPPLFIIYLKLLRSNTQRLDFSVSVSFTDVTGPASPLFADIPVLQAKFPHDFFYPFVSSSALVTTASQIMSVILLSYICLY